MQNYPNPFNPSTTIEYRMPRAGYAVLKVFDMLGREVRTLQEGWRGAGTHQARFEGGELPSGVYIYRLTTNGVSRTMKMILAK
jgi:hypothetical protein